MWLPQTGNNWISSFQWVEVALYSEARSSVLRHKTSDGNSLLINVNDLETWRHKTKNIGLYTSIFQHSTEELNISDPYLGNLYFDLDCEEDAEIARQETIKLYRHLVDNDIPEEAIGVFYTGLKGFHLEVEAFALGVVPNVELAHIYRSIGVSIKDKLGLTSLDMAVYEPRRMWRLVNSKHQKTGLYKVCLHLTELNETIESIQKLAEKPRDIGYSDQIFNARANMWYREYIYEYETKETFNQQSLIDRFNREGIRNSHEIGDVEMEFDPLNLFTHCHAIKDLWSKAERENDLSHEERLFLCSILTYTDEAIEYLHAILSLCSDYNYERSLSHIQDWIARREKNIGGRPYSCQRANSAGVGCLDCDLPAKRQYYKVGDRLMDTGQDALPSPIRYAYSYKKRSPISDGNEKEKSS